MNQAEVIEHAFMCPYCWKTITMLLDPSAEVQKYVEDCEVCCNPIEIDFIVTEQALVQFDARAL